MSGLGTVKLFWQNVQLYVQLDIELLFELIKDRNDQRRPTGTSSMSFHAAQSALAIISHCGGGLLRSVPFIMCRHLNIEFFQASAASILTRNHLRTCLMMILRHSGRAPKPFVHPFHGMSYHDMSRHDNQKLRLLF